jgi:hypothetical protein
MSNSTFLRSVRVTPTAETSAVADGDLTVNTTLIPGACAGIDQPTYLVGCNLFDLDDNTAADIRVIFLAANTSLGTLNSPPTIADADVENIIGDILIDDTDWHDLGGSKFVRINPAKLPIPMRPATGTPNIYFAILAGGALTFTASGIRAEFYFQDTYPF